ncbi:MAG: ATP-dependent zinc metalloprotease FtsH [Sphaerochaetaceae bacterium]|nr:ATP-dependent zinc metalloprotease FtsH [Sphaerochaetaceae bacterium]MDC7243148.1 ATP-dependent zinc metalloprotease FtsH [Sphaerochaetaceae bacterium]MDC7250889.1 ATP-dependent zinc metalloprotease FtsH [Sphaerochaetaceae bacterium]
MNNFYNQDRAKAGIYLEENNNNNDKKPDKNDFWNGLKGGGSSPNNKNDGNGPFKNPKNRLSFGIFVFVLLTFGILMFDSMANGSAQSVPYTTFKQYVASGQVQTVDIEANQKITFITSTNVQMRTLIPYVDENLLEELENNGVIVSGSEQQISYLSLFLSIVPWIIFVGFMVILYRQANGMNTKMMGGLGKNLAKEYKPDENKTSFNDVAGQLEAKNELMEVVDFLKNPSRFHKIGAKIPKGALLVGPPGTGKTLLAKAVAGEAGVSFLHTSGSDFVEMFVGMGASRVRDLFEQARKAAPCIIFIDELDAVGRARGSGLGGGHDEREQTLNQILVEMDGFDSISNVIVMAATNRPDVLDQALLRPGRFDRQVVVDLPDIKEREAILKIHCKKVKLEAGVDLMRIARATPGSSGADLANMINEAALFAARENKETVSMGNIEAARDKVMLGVAKKSKFMSEDDKKATAYHEAGHTLLHYYLSHVDPLHKVTIIPHGRALGLTISLPEKDAYTLTKSKLVDRIKITMGGYVAEELVYGETTTGTSNDIQQATNLAKRMVTEFGMSSLGFINLGDEEEPLFLGREIAQHKNFSEATAKIIDEEMLKILNKCLDETRDILKSHRDQLDLLTNELVEKETLDDAEIRELLGFEPIENKFSLT